MALDAIAALSPARVPVPALLNVRIKLDPSNNNAVTMESWDFDTHVSVQLKTLVTSRAKGFNVILVSRSQLTACVRSLTAGSTKAKQAGLPITFTADGKTLEVAADGGYVTTLQMQPADEFPDVPHYEDFDDGAIVTVDRDLMLTTITRLQVCAGVNETLPMLTGISFKSVDGGLEMVTTDRHRLAMAFMPTLEPESQIDAVVPAKPLSTIFRHLPAGQVACSFFDPKRLQMARFRSGPVSIATRTLDDQFPKYHSLIPSEKVGDVVMSRADLAIAVKRASSIMNDGHNVRIEFADSKATVTGLNEDVKVTSPAFRVEQVGEDLAGPIAFNPKYLGQALSTFGSDAVAIRYQTPQRPVLIAEPGELDNPRAYRTLVMPARLPG